jgi:hypothetical protein
MLAAVPRYHRDLADTTATAQAIGAIRRLDGLRATTTGTATQGAFAHARTPPGQARPGWLDDLSRERRRGFHQGWHDA